MERIISQNRNLDVNMLTHIYNLRTSEADTGGW